MAAGRNPGAEARAGDLGSERSGGELRVIARERKVEFLEVYELLGAQAARVRAILDELGGTVRTAGCSLCRLSESGPRLHRWK